MIVVISNPNAGRTWMMAMLKRMGCEIYASHMGGFGEDAVDIEKFLTKYPNKFINDDLIILHRDPRDNIVSNKYQLQYRNRNRISTNASFLDLIESKQYGIEKIVKYNLFMKDIKCRSKIVVSYEELSSDTFGTMFKLLEFCGNENRFDTEMLNETIEYWKIENAREREKNKIGNEYWYQVTDVTNPDSFKARKGIVGGYKESLTAEEIARCDEIMEQYDYHNKMKEVP